MSLRVRQSGWDSDTDRVRRKTERVPHVTQNSGVRSESGQRMRDPDGRVYVALPRVHVAP